MTIQHDPIASRKPATTTPRTTTAPVRLPSLPLGLHLVPCVEDDRAYVLALTQLTMLDVVHATHFSPEAVRHYFVQHGFDLQHTHLISWRGRTAGRVTVVWGEAGAHLADVHIHPAYQGLGIGTAVLGYIAAQARLRGVPVHTEILRLNRALRLFERLGFVPDGASRHEFGLTLPVTAADPRA